jgi:hypothetical protein
MIGVIRNQTEGTLQKLVDESCGWITVWDLWDERAN